MGKRTTLDRSAGRSLGGDPAASIAPREEDSTSRSKYGYVAALALTLLLVATLVPAGRQILARRGVLDVSGSPSRAGVERLDGEWAFYWDRLLRPADFSGGSPPPDAYMRLPSTWTRSRLHGRPVPSVGDATFRLTVVHPWAGRELGVKLMKINCAFELYADSRLIAKAGELGDTPGGFKGGYSPQSVFFTPASDRTVLTLLISNRIPGSWSGSVEGISFGPRQAIEGETNGSIVADAFNVSGRLVFMVLFLTLFLITKSRLAAVYSLTSLNMALRISLEREMLFLRLLPALDINVFERLYLFSTLLSLPLLLYSFEAYLRESGGSPRDLPGLAKGRFAAWRLRDWVLALVTAWILILALYLIVAGNSIYLRYFMVFIPISLACYGYYSVLIFRDAVERRLGIGPAGIYLLLLFYSAFEILCLLRVIDQNYMFPLFFLRDVPTLASLATVQIQQGIVSYLDIAFLSFYFLYDILRRYLARRHESAPDSDRGTLLLDDPREIAMIEERVEKALSQPATLGRPDLDMRALAAIVKIPPYRLSIWFNTCLKSTFSEHLNARRIERMQALMLEHPERTILDIAMEAGYASKSVFNEQFRRLTGMSPSEWRRANRTAKR